MFLFSKEVKEKIIKNLLRKNIHLHCSEAAYNCLAGMTAMLFCDDVDKNGNVMLRVTVFILADKA